MSYHVMYGVVRMCRHNKPKTCYMDPRCNDLHAPLCLINIDARRTAASCSNRHISKAQEGVEGKDG